MQIQLEQFHLTRLCMHKMPHFKAVAFIGALILSLLTACVDQGTEPVIIPPIPCEDANVLTLPRFSVTVHKKWEKVRGEVITTIPGSTLANEDSVRTFFGGKQVKLVFVINRIMYLVVYGKTGKSITKISHDDEGLNGAVGSINSPLFSPDGKKIVFAGTTRGKPSFVLDAVEGNAEAIRLPLDPKAHVLADPHWHTEGDSTFIYFATLAGLVNYSENCKQILGSTYKVPLLNDTLAGNLSVTRIPGAYRGGISKDGNWLGTSYASSAIYDRKNASLQILANGDQQCNPSMNPYPTGSKHMDYMMILAFGGKYNTITGDSVSEGLHENLWIYNHRNQIVWQAKRIDENYYLRYDKPEWSTHPNYATAVALRREDENGDLFVIQIGDLANKDEGKLNQAEAYFKIISGGFNSDSYSHLWVEP